MRVAFEAFVTVLCTLFFLQELLLSGEIVPTGPDASRPQQRGQRD